MNIVNSFVSCCHGLDGDEGWHTWQQRVGQDQWAGRDVQCNVRHQSQRPDDAPWRNQQRS